MNTKLGQVVQNVCRYNIALTLVLAFVTLVKCPEDHQAIQSMLARPCIRPNHYAPRHFFGLASLMKSQKWHTPVKMHTVSSLLYLCFLLLSLSADTELNPGPIDFPCGNCALEVLETDPAIECNECGQWFHIQCQFIEHSTYDDLVASDHSVSWICSNCDCPNFSNPAQSSFASYELPNNFSVLTDKSLPIPHPSLSSTQVAQPRGDTAIKTSKLVL